MPCLRLGEGAISEHLQQPPRQRPRSLTTTRGGCGGLQMRILSVVCSVLVLTGPAFGQHLALTPAKPDCPPGDPDSLQISWTAPCDSGDWLFDTQTGCRMWDWHPDPEDKGVWKGACRAGQPEGRGEQAAHQHAQEGRPGNESDDAERDECRQLPARSRSHCRPPGRCRSSGPAGAGLTSRA